MRFPRPAVSRDELARFLFAEEWPDLSESDFERTAPDRFLNRADAILAQFAVIDRKQPSHDSATTVERETAVALENKANRSAWLRSQARAAGYGAAERGADQRTGKGASK